MGERELGTKWDAYNTLYAEIDDEDSAVKLQFDTAWIPPEPVLDAIMERWPNLIISGNWHEESGSGGTF